eukprot:5345428-Alexandrium_andersonii.AAC.1
MSRHRGAFSAPSLPLVHEQVPRGAAEARGPPLRARQSRAEGLSPALRCGGRAHADGGRNGRTSPSAD